MQAIQTIRKFDKVKNLQKKRVYLCVFKRMCNKLKIIHLKQF